MNPVQRKQAYNHALSEAQQAISRGDRLAARRWAARAAQIAPQQEAPWLMLAAVASPRASVAYLERALEINPGSLHAREGMEWALKRLREESAAETKPVRAGAVTAPWADHNSERPPPTARTKHKVHIQPATLAVQQKSLRMPRVNGPLFLGLIIIVLVGWLAIKGPELAPRDPLEQNTILRGETKWYTPPFPVGIPGYPLGSDDVGRDLYSRLLWAIKPTFQMVLIVAAVRLVLGAMIGLIAGWSQGWPGRALDALISAALAVPIIMIALGGIAAVGVELGIWAFVIGLSLTGWVETARLVREQTVAIRGQVYVEAARSLGASSWQLLTRHVLRQVYSMLWMLFAFEISNTLMLTAALGFLGYYIGGDIWVQVTDATARAVTGAPELGQMLATSGNRFTQPWGLVAIGAVIFSAVLGFNLLGEGLRRRASLSAPRRRTFLNQALGRIGLWVEDRVMWPIGRLARNRFFRIVTLIVLAVGGTAFVWIEGRAPRPDDENAFQTEANRSLWGTAHGDPAGTRYAAFQGPETGQTAWTFSDPEGFAGGPVVGKDGVIYAAGKSGTLYALSPAGDPFWKSELLVKPAAGPSLGVDGTVYVADIDGGLTAFKEGVLQWHTDSELAKAATANPVIVPDGTIYYPVGTYLQAISPKGHLLWSLNTGSLGGGLASPLVFDHLGFLEHTSFDPQNGTMLDLLEQINVDQYIIGADGQLYYRKGNDIFPWNFISGQLEAEEPIHWEYSKFTTGRPQTAGVTPDGLIWLFYSSFSRSRRFGEDTRIVWLDPNGEVLGNAHYGTRNSAPIAVDADKTLYTCGNLRQGYGPMECQAFAFGEEEPLWTLEVDGFEMAGGALAPGRLYVTTTDRYLHAIGDEEVVLVPTSPPAQGETQPKTPTPETAIQPTGDHIGPTRGTFALIFEDTSGFVGAPVASEESTIFIAANNGELYALTPSGEIIWQTTLPATPVGGPALSGSILYATDQAGLTTFDPAGNILWRFEPEMGKAVAGPAIGPDGTVYYTLDISSKGYIQAVSAAGEGLWQTPVETFTYFRTPQPAPDGHLVFFRGEAYDATNGAPVDLGFDFKPDRLFVGGDGQIYLLLQDTLARWTYNNGRAVMAEERVITSFGAPTEAGVTPEGVIWAMGRDLVAWFTPAGEGLTMSTIDSTFLQVVMGVDGDWTVYACGRKPVSFLQSPEPYCFAFSPDSQQPLWETKLNTQFEEFTGGVLLPNMLIIATEQGHLYVIRSQ